MERIEPEIVKVQSSNLLLSAFPPCLLQLLVEADADVNLVNDDGDTPLHLAAWYGQFEMAEASQRHHLEI